MTGSRPTPANEILQGIDGEFDIHGDRGHFVLIRPGLIGCLALGRDPATIHAEDEIDT
jgi:hypothetical protein